MTIRPSNMPELHVASADSAVVEHGLRETGPYALPASEAGHAVDAVLIDAIRATVRPYVPAPWRGRPEIATDLPWIDAFLNESREDVADEIVVESVAAVPTEAPSFVVALEAVAAEEPLLVDALEAVAGEELTTVGATADSVELPSDAWPLDDAGATMRALADELLAREPATKAIDEPTTMGDPPVASTPPLPMWGDDDMMDIMPVKPSRASVESTEHWAERARRETERAGSPEAAALALESLARRIRDGEIALPGYTSDMGDAAALATALAALLSVRR
ncbi:MAG: hypothetical protein ABMA00_11130 [Gemmatimonas sp.]